MVDRARFVPLGERKLTPEAQAEWDRGMAEREAERDRLFRDMQAQRDEALARVEKLTEMLDGLTPCGADCGVMALGAWVDPSDSKRVHEMRDLLRERVRALTLAVEQFCPDVKGALAWVDMYVSLGSGTSAEQKPAQ